MNLVDVKVLEPTVNKPVLLAMVLNNKIVRAERGYLTPTPGMYSVRFPVTHWCLLPPPPEPEQKVNY